jgi:hypothetical protein
MPPTSTAEGWRFDQVLAAVGRAAGGEVAENTAAYQGRIVLECLLEQAERAATPTADTLAELYVEAAQAAPSKSSRFAAVAEELGLRPGLTPAQLASARRGFALANHPDRVSPDEREEATRRMAMANILIDRAVKQSRSHD